jgi:hypothetical protein
MELNQLFSENEINTAELYISKLERSIKDWRITKWLLCFAVIMLFVVGIHCIYVSWSVTKTDHIMDYINTQEIPEGTLTKYWYVAEVRRCAIILERSFTEQSLKTLYGVSGIILIGSALVGVFWLKTRWYNHNRDKLIAKFLRFKLEAITNPL